MKARVLMPRLVGAMARRINHFAHAIELRSELLSELSRASQKGVAFPRKTGLSVWRHPSAVEPFIRLLRFLNPNEEILLIDVGANDGYWAEKFLNFFPNTHAYCFEPVSTTFDKLARRFANRAKVSVFNVAVSDATGFGTIQVASTSTMSTLHAYEGVRADSSTQILRQERVTTAPLDQFSFSAEPGVRFLKVDVQGHELEVLRGATNVLEACDLVQLELSITSEYADKAPAFPHAVEILLKHGFYPVVFEEFGRLNGPYAMERDILFVRRHAIECLGGW